MSSEKLGEVAADRDFRGICSVQRDLREWCSRRGDLRMRCSGRGDHRESSSGCGDHLSDCSRCGDYFPSPKDTKTARGCAGNPLVSAGGIGDPLESVSGSVVRDALRRAGLCWLWRSCLLEKLEVSAPVWTQKVLGFPEPLPPSLPP